MDFQKTKLANGLRLITIPMPQVQSATVLILVGAGSRYEKKETSGLSHFLEHMAFKGTERRPTALAISSEIEGIGGEFNAFTSKDQTAFFVKAAAKHLPQTIDVLADMLLHSRFAAEEIERERGVIIEEINLYEDTPARKIGEIYEELLYGDTPLGWDIAGRRETIAKIQRQDFLDYTQDLYTPENAVVIVAGGIDEIKNKQSFSANEKLQFKIKNLIEKSFGDWKNKAKRSFEPAGDQQEKPVCKVVFKKTEQAHLALGVRGYHLFHPDRFVLSLLSTILGGGMSSRLFIQVRERRGLAYYVHTAAEHYADVGHLVTQAGVDLKKMEEAIKVILEEYRKVAKAGQVEKKELTKAKEFLKGRLILELEDSKNVASLFGSSELLEGKIRTPAEMIAEVEKVRQEDLVRVAEDIFRPERLNLAVIGPFEDGKKFEKLLNC